MNHVQTDVGSVDLIPFLYKPSNVIWFPLQALLTPRKIKMNRARWITRGTIMASALLGPAFVQAEHTIVDFVHTKGYHYFREADSTSSTGNTWNFSDETLLVHGPEVDGESNTSVYGGLRAHWPEGETNKHIFQLNPNDEGLKLQVKFDGNAVGKRMFEGIIVWNKADFLALADSVVSFGSGSSMSLKVSAGGGSMTRFVVNDGGVYYVSNTVKQGRSGNGGVIRNDPSADTWATINTSDYSIGPFAARTFTDIQGVGVYINQATKSDSRMHALYRLKGFQVKVAPAKVDIPESSMFGLLVSVVALTGVVCRRR